MKRMKLTTTLVCALTVLAFSTGAWAENDPWGPSDFAEEADWEEVDWEEAIEFAEVTDTFVENGVKWVTYYDELQNVMWSQPADASSEAALAYHGGDFDTARDLGLDCTIYWPVPTFIGFKHSGSGGTWDLLYPSAHSATLTSTSSTLREWTYYSYSWYQDLDGAGGRVQTRTNYCTNSLSRLSYELEDGTAGWFTPESYNCWLDGGMYYISGADETTVDDWEGVSGNQNRRVSQHRIYACGNWRYVQQRLRTYWIEK